MFYADLHIHSRYSRATSLACTLDGLAVWAQRKGIRVVGTGDFTHPVWFETLKARLRPAEPGLFALAASEPFETAVPDACHGDVRFMLTGEISSIYKRDGRVRKVHSLVLAPSFAAVERINRELAALGNIASDGRPILGLDPRRLLEILLAADPACALIPAHIWTPWFSLLGARSGFDSPEEAFGELLPHIFAVETGLSSDAPMNHRVPALDRFVLVSNSDLHSPANLGRNATVFHGEPDYFAMLDGLRRKDPAVCGGTVDLYPEEGKYFLDGHRACGVVVRPGEPAPECCPVCGKPLTQGVLRRVTELARRPSGVAPADALPWRYQIPLAELVAQLMGVGPGSVKVAAVCEALLTANGPELPLLLDRPLDTLVLPAAAPSRLLDALAAMRRGDVRSEGGYDGVYGTVVPRLDGERG